MWTIDELKKNHQMIHWFGLGFIQLKLNKHQRLHFYTTKYSPIIEDTEYHNHRYDFSSKVLFGSLTIFITRFTKDSMCAPVSSLIDPVLKYQESCNKDKKIYSKPEQGFMTFGEYFTAKQGDLYYCNHEEFHKVKTSEDTITLLNRSDYKKEYADILRPVGQESVCPFSKEVPEVELWEIVEEMWSKVCQP